MPNYCENLLTVSDMTPELENYLKENGLSFEKIAPLSGTTAENTFERIDEQVSLWGTKWDLSPDEQKECADSLVEGGECRFDTAWSPPEKAIEKLSAMFPDNTFELHYAEMGNGFAGSAYFQAGVVSEEAVDLDDKEALKDFLIDKLGYPEEDAAEVAGIED